MSSNYNMEVTGGSFTTSFDSVIVISEGDGTGGTSDHAALTNRDASDQHPISAITGLQEALDSKTALDLSVEAVSLAAGEAATVTKEDIDGVTKLTFGIPQGVQGVAGNDGVGISDITRTSGNGAAGTTDTYTITLTDGRTSEFTVYNGADGVGGDGSSSGAGADGVGIKSIERTAGDGSSGSTDIYTITLTDGRTSEFTIYNGMDGTTGVAGITPHIGTNGNWFIGTTDTGVAAQGSSSTEITTASLPASGWSSDTLTQEITVPGVIEDELSQIVTIVPTTASQDAYESCSITCCECACDALKFEASTAPTEDIEIYVILETLGGSAGSGEVYSTEETVVGTWIDGKPIYQITILTTTANKVSTTTTVADLSHLNIDECIDITSMFRGTSDDYYWYSPGNRTYTNNTYSSVWVSDSVIRNLITNSDWLSRPLRITVKYTKNSDEATIDTTSLMNYYDDGVNLA